MGVVSLEVDEEPPSDAIQVAVHQVRQAPRLPDWIWMVGVLGCGVAALAIAAVLTVRVQPGHSSGAFAGSKHVHPRGPGVVARAEAPFAEPAVSRANVGGR